MIHNITRTITFLTYTQVYCISLVKTISTNWDHIRNIWFLSSCAKYTKNLKRKRKRKLLPHQFIKPPNSNTDKPPLKMSTITTQTTLNNRLEVREENDALGVNDLKTRIFTTAATLPNLPPPLSQPLQLLNTDTHIVRHHWVRAGMMQEVNSLLPALNAQAQSLCCLDLKPTTTTPQSTSKRDWNG